MLRRDKTVQRVKPGACHQRNVVDVGGRDRTGSDGGSLKGDGACLRHVPHTKRRDEGVKGVILTAIDEPVVVLGVRAVAVALFAEEDGGDALGAPGSVVVERHLAQGADGGVEEFLQRRGVRRRLATVKKW